jgi:hypothetical protein
MLDLPLFKTTAGESIIKFQPRHLYRLQLKDPEATRLREDPNMLLAIEASYEPTATWTGMYRGTPVLCFGLRILGPGVAEAWMLPGKDIGNHAISLGRGGRKIFQHYLESGAFRRIQIAVEEDNAIAFRFARWLGFEVEGIMRRFAVNGGNYIMMSRIADNGATENTNGTAR